MQHGSNEWLEARRDKITATGFVELYLNINGMSGLYGVEGVVAEKLGFRREFNETLREFMELGLLFEEHKKKELNVNSKVLVHNDLMASLDGISMDRGIVVEFKLTGKRGNNLDRLKYATMLQLDFQLYVTYLKTGRKLRGYIYLGERILRYNEDESKYWSYGETEIIESDYKVLDELINTDLLAKVRNRLELLKNKISCYSNFEDLGYLCYKFVKESGFDLWYGGMIIHKGLEFEPMMQRNGCLYYIKNGKKIKFDDRFVK